MTGYSENTLKEMGSAQRAAELLRRRIEDAAASVAGDVSAAHSVEDVQRLAPEPGAYWIRDRRSGVSSEWSVASLGKYPGGFRRWWIFGNECDEPDSEMIGFEIVGPIPEPAE